MFKKLNWNIFKRSKKPKSSKLTLSEIVWFGFNYTVGISFTAVFFNLIYGSVKTELGVHMIWIFLVEGLIAGTCAWAFARLSRVHPGNNGAAYIYVRSSYGRFWGWIIAFIQYSTLPVIVTSQIISMIRLNFTTEGTIFYAHWGVWTNLGLDLIGIAVYGLASCVLFLGMQAFRRFVNISAYLKWITTGLLMIAVIVLFVKLGWSNYDNVYHNHSNLTAGSFSNAFTTCFFFFLGFETYATIGKNVQNPQRNIGRSILIVMILTTVFYIVVTFLMIGAVIGQFGKNPNIQIFQILGAQFHAEWLGVLGMVIMLICTISLKANAGMQNALYSGGILEPLSVEGYIPEKFQQLNQDKIAFRASLLNLIVTFIFAFLWLVIPDLIQAITDSAKGAVKPSTVFDYGTITGETSLIMIIIYSVVISIALKLSWQKKLRHNYFEVAIWLFAFIFLIWQLVMWVWNLADQFQTAINNINMTAANFKPTDDFKTLAEMNAAGVSLLISNILQVFYIVLVFGFAVGWYFTYYAKKLKYRLANDLQDKYDYDFRIKDDWPFVAKHLQAEIENYLQRNVIIHGNKNNDNYQFAKDVRSELLSSEGEWREDEE